MCVVQFEECLNTVARERNVLVLARHACIGIPAASRVRVPMMQHLDADRACARGIDEGHEAEKVSLIDKGLLVRGIGGSLSAQRMENPDAAMAVTRACSWNRPPIDRMANLNVEPGETPMTELIGGIEKGIWLDVNSSWSIDDRRWKFQFGVEDARLIEDGELTTRVKDAGYRSTTIPFWNSLDAVGDRETWQVRGTPNCGKGEPNQMVFVGHAMPACRFRGLEVFGREG